MKNLELYFDRFRKNTIGSDASIRTPYGIKPIIYADWIASGRLYRPIEEFISEKIGPYIANTHSEASATGAYMTRAYHEAHAKIKQHVNAGPEDVIITAGSGMTTVVNKLQRILGLRIPEKWQNQVQIPEEERPVIFVSHMEHHSNHTSWLETIAKIICIEPDKNDEINLEHLEELLIQYKDRKLKIGAFTACSNVTGILTPYYKLAKLMHQHQGICFIDFAAGAPYLEINMHPEDPMEKLDAIYFSAHKFLGGPGSPGILVFDSNLYSNKVPDNPGGGTVNYTNRWNEYSYISDIEVREDGGTPGFLQAIRAALSMQLKEEMNPVMIEKREEEQLNLFYQYIDPIPEIHILADHHRKRLGVVSMYFENIHFNLVVKLLSDRYGIQARGGCSCAGTYGHYLLHLSRREADNIYEAIQRGNLSTKPGWVRISFHPTMTNKEIIYIGDALQQIIENGKEWAKDYTYNSATNEFTHHAESSDEGIKLSLD